MGRIDLEFDPLLEVDQVEVDLVGAVVQGEVGDQSVHQGRLARAGAPGDQGMLRRSMAEREMLALGGARLTERDINAIAAVVCPVGAPGRTDELERYFNALGVSRGRADVLDLPGGELRRRR